jgi:hypothetical protein
VRRRAHSSVAEPVEVPARPSHRRVRPQIGAAGGDAAGRAGTWMVHGRVRVAGGVRHCSSWWRRRCAEPRNLPWPGARGGGGQATPARANPSQVLTTHERKRPFGLTVGPHALNCS